MAHHDRGRVKDDLRQSLSNLLSLHGPRHDEYFGYFILRATGLLVFVRMVTFHTASVGSRPPNWVPSVWFAPLVFGRRDGISLPQKATGTARRGSHMVASAGAAENDPASTDLKY